MIQIEYKGADGQNEAAQIHAQLTSHDTEVEEVKEIKMDDVRMGAIEVIVTLVVSSAAKAAALAAIGYLENYFRERAKGRATDGNLRVVIKSKDSGRVARFPAGFRQLADNAISIFFDKVRKGISDL